MESKRQQQIGKLVQQAMSEVFQVYGPEYYGRAFVTISGVRVTPDLLIARTYLSVYNVEDKEAVVKEMKNHTAAIRNRVGRKIRNKVRRIPELEFFLDDTLDSVFRLDDMFKDMSGEEE